MEYNSNMLYLKSIWRGFPSESLSWNSCRDLYKSIGRTGPTGAVTGLAMSLRRPGLNGLIPSVVRSGIDIFLVSWLTL